MQTIKGTTHIDVSVTICTRQSLFLPAPKNRTSRKRCSIYNCSTTLANLTIFLYALQPSSCMTKNVLKQENVCVSMLFHTFLIYAWIGSVKLISFFSSLNAFKPLLDEAVGNPPLKTMQQFYHWSNCVKKIIGWSSAIQMLLLRRTRNATEVNK